MQAMKTFHLERHYVPGPCKTFILKGRNVGFCSLKDSMAPREIVKHLFKYPLYATEIFHLERYHVLKRTSETCILNG